MVAVVTGLTLEEKTVVALEYNSEGKPKTNLVQVVCLSVTLDTYSKWQEKLITCNCFCTCTCKHYSDGRGGKGTSVNSKCEGGAYQR